MLLLIQFRSLEPVFWCYYGNRYKQADSEMARKFVGQYYRQLYGLWPPNLNRS